MMRQYISLFVGLIFFSFGSLFSCGWCDPQRPIEALSLIKEDARYDASRSALLAGVTLSKKYEPLPICLKRPGANANPPVHDRFYADYLSVYFPKADVIRFILMPTMCSEALCRSMSSLVFLITHAPWRYFVNNKDDFVFESVYVSILEEQLSLIIDSVLHARIDPKTTMLLDRQNRAGIYLMRYLNQKGKEKDFFTMAALLVDIIIYRLYHFIKNEEYVSAHERNQELQRRIELLSGSPFEQQYMLTARLFSDLLKMLHARLWSQAETSDNDDALVLPALASNAFDHLTVVDTKNTSAQKFLDSFITHYEANITGKFTHEYHPLVLDETARSFAKLEKELIAHQLPIVGRLTLMGYEEQGVTRYKTSYTDVDFSDEMARRTNAGWSLKMFNRFGLLTGFLCKDVAVLNNDLKGELPVTHIDSDQIEIFDGIGTLFQEHAFGEAFKPTMRAYERAQKYLLRKSLPDFFAECMKFWQILYSHELKATGKQHVVGTQDILFSIAYMRYVQQSAVPMLHFYVGPDITYPIETSLLHNEESTRHAQAFVKTFVPQLKPLNGKKTAYVFCSFVDGVGKSTMLGNVQNAMKHGSAVEKYEHVDNSSSQLATVFDYSSDVVIADLPAQVSHFTYKPDGFVYVDIGALSSTQEVEELQAYVRSNKKILEERFDHLLAAAHSWKNYDLIRSEKENPELSYALNLHLLDKAETSEWVSFSFKGEYYLFDSEQPEYIRKRMPLAVAPSHGLKNCCPEQMIFSDGVRFPMAYDYFLNDLMTQLKEHGAEHVVMVDFISMYSRSSRENIRVNYVIQQLALLNKDFSLENSFYQDFVHNAQLLALLDAPGKERQFIDTLKQESLLRLGLFEMLFDHATTNIEGVDLGLLTEKLAARLNNYDQSIMSYATERVSHKVSAEHDRLFHAYGQAREYVTLQQFQPTDARVWSNELYACMVNENNDENIQDLWRLCPAEDVVLAETMVTHSSEKIVTATLSTGGRVEIIGRISPDCRDRQKLLTLLRMSRARWYAACANILYSSKKDGALHVKEKIPVLPLVVLFDTEGELCFVQPLLPQPVSLENEKLPNYSLFGIEKMPNKPEQWRVYNNTLYLHDWSTVMHSHGGVFAYGHELSSEPIENQQPRSAIVSNLYTKFAQAYGADKVLVPAMLNSMMKEKKSALASNYERWKKESAKNGTMPDNGALPTWGKKSKKELDSVKVYALKPEQKEAAQLFIRMIATLDMCVKDLDSDFALRRNNKEDFMAHVALLEKITMPWLFGLFSADRLFETYDEVTPVCVFE